MQVYKETIWHFTCQSCDGWWSIANYDKWVPKNLYCPHCGKQRTHDKEFFESVDDKGHIRLGTSSYSRAEDSFQKEICSCGHKVIDCDCKAGCKCGCNKRFLGAE